MRMDSLLLRQFRNYYETEVEYVYLSLIIRSINLCISLTSLYYIYSNEVEK